MDNIQKKRHTIYWLEIAQHDYETMVGLFQIKRYSDALFYGHIVLEKVLKARSVFLNNQFAPITHDLIVLAKLSRFNLTKEEVYWLKTINSFNIRSRYPDYKLNFYKKCNYEYSLKYLNRIKYLYKKLCQPLKFLKL